MGDIWQRPKPLWFIPMDSDGTTNVRLIDRFPATGAWTWRMSFKVWWRP